MKKILQLTFIIFIIFCILFYQDSIIDSINMSFTICTKGLFPSLIPFMLLSNIIINYNIIKNNIIFVVFMSMLSGAPSNSKYLKDLLDKNELNENTINKVLTFCHYTNPIFVIYTVGFLYLNNKKLGLIIIISQYISSFILYLKSNINNSTSKNNNITNNNRFIYILSKSIYSTFNTLILILGIITTCLIITSILNNLLNINNNYKFIYGILEITQGLKFLSLSNINITIKSILASFMISFGGLCIHAQVFSILDNKKIRYLSYLKSRIIHGIISSIITLILILLCGLN